MVAKAQKADAPQPEEPKVPAVQTLNTGLTKLSEEELAELQGVEGAGLTDSVEDRGTPLIYIAQRQTPQAEERDAKYVKGLKPGMVFNNLTGRFWDAEHEGFPICPCFTRVSWDEWTPRDDGGGFHGSHPRNVDMKAMGAKNFVTKQGKVRRDVYTLPNGHELKLTQKYYAVLPGDWTPVVIPMASVNLGVATRLQALIGDQKAQVGNRVVIKPAFWQIYRLKTVYKTGEGNTSWFEYSVSADGPNENAELRKFCKAFAIACQNNEIKESEPIKETSSGPDPKDKDIPI